MVLPDALPSLQLPDVMATLEFHQTLWVATTFNRPTSAAPDAVAETSVSTAREAHVESECGPCDDQHSALTAGPLEGSWTRRSTGSMIVVLISADLA